MGIVDAVNTQLVLIENTQGGTPVSLSWKEFIHAQGVMDSLDGVIREFYQAPNAHPAANQILRLAREMEQAAAASKITMPYSTV